jgi:glycosyltransferase involved in cell wall biosynthesis
MPPTKQSHWEIDKIRLLYVGRLEREKSIGRILDVMDDTMCLVVVGKGQQGPELSRMAQGRGLDVRFIGAVPHDELPEWYCSTDFFIMPSGSETLGFTTLEAMACGVVTMGFAAGGTLDIIQDQQTGLLWSSTDELRDLITHIYPKTRFRQKMGHAAELRYSQYTIEASTEDLVRTYDRLINESPTHVVLSGMFGTLPCYALLCFVYMLERVLDVVSIVW